MYMPERQCVMCVTCLGILFLFTQVGLVYDKVDLTGIVIHNWVPTHGIYFILRFCPLNPSQAEYRNLATVPRCSGVLVISTMSTYGKKNKQNASIYVYNLSYP